MQYFEQDNLLTKSMDELPKRINDIEMRKRMADKPEHMAWKREKMADKPECISMLPKRRIASSLAEFSNNSFSQSSAENSFDSFDESFRSSKSTPRFHMRPVHTLALMLLLVTALCASLTMLISQSLTYQRVQNDQAEAWQKLSNNPEYDANFFSKSNEKGFGKNKRSKENNSNQISDNNAENAENNENAEYGTGESNNENAGNAGNTEESANSSARSTSKNNSGASAGNTTKTDLNRINLNTATAAQLQTLKGIGPKTVARIIAQRKRVGGFRSLEDLLQIKGIGPKTLNKFRGKIYVN